MSLELAEEAVMKHEDEEDAVNPDASPAHGPGAGVRPAFTLDLVADAPARALVRVFISHDSSTDAPVVALVEQSLGTFDPALYATSIASEICRRESLPFERLLLITRDRFRFERVADWTILLGPFEMMAQQERVLRGEEETESFELVAFDVEAGALVRPRRTPLCRADVEEIIGGPI